MVSNRSVTTFELDIWLGSIGRRKLFEKGGNSKIQNKLFRSSNEYGEDNAPTLVCLQFDQKLDCNK